MNDQQTIAKLTAERDAARVWATRAYTFLKEVQAMHRDSFFLANKDAARERGLAWMEKIQGEIEAYESRGQTAPAGTLQPKP